MKKAKRCLIAVVSGVLVASAVLSGCGQSKKEVSINDDHLTVYLWENRLMKNIAPYIHEQFPDQDIEFIIGNNDTDVYSYFKEHDELPDIITLKYNKISFLHKIKAIIRKFANQMKVWDAKLQGL